LFGDLNWLRIKLLIAP